MFKVFGETSPRSFLFYIVADVGLSGDSHRPLAVAYRQGHGPSPGRYDTRAEVRVNHVLEDCARLASILSDPTNRAGLEAEIALARSWYQEHLQHPAPHRPVLPDEVQPGFWNQKWIDSRSGMPDRPGLEWRGGIREFPFTSTCLRLGLNADRTYFTRPGDVQEQSLDTVFHLNNVEYGAVVLDVTDLDNVGYGILSSSVIYAFEDYDPIQEIYSVVEGWEPGNKPVIQLEKSPARQPLSGTDYMRKHGIDIVTSAIEQLRRHSVVKGDVINYVCPPSTPVEAPEGPARQSVTPDEDISRLIQGARDTELIIEDFGDTVGRPDFQGRLLARLQQDPVALDGPLSATQLLPLAFSGQSHLNLVTLKYLSYDTIAATLRSARLGEAEAFSICLDEINDGDSPEPLINALDQHENIRTICFLDGPLRTDEVKSTRLFAQLRESPQGRSLLSSRRVILTCAFSAPFQRKQWLPDLARNTTLLEDFPVQQMFVRQQYLNPSDENGPLRFRPCHFSLTDALLGPQLLVDGFLRYCQSIITDRFLFSFAAAPSSLEADDRQFPGLTIKPIPAENCAIPESALISDANGEEKRVDLWPAFRPLEPGSWIILVSHEWFTNKLQKRKIVSLACKGSLYGMDPGLPCSRYAFLRVKERVELPDGPEDDVDAFSSPEYLEIVGGVKEFLRETAPTFDEEAIDGRLVALELAWREEWPVYRGRKSFLSVLNEQTARSVLKDFLRDAMRVRGNLKAAMLEMPEEERWYPELLPEPPGSPPRKRRRVDSSAEPSVGSSARGDGIFRTLYDRTWHDSEVQGPVLLGTDAPALPAVKSLYYVSDDGDL
ncbi:hypothetical protein V497_00844 [Pseudogymnoascus sp. VKM F-4516 (FW-969)]|nr:hypothetical protein V497_00844 [Pseudogymnoascus sp. VKM F-4516 (FW-969)]